MNYAFKKPGVPGGTGGYQGYQGGIFDSLNVKIYWLKNGFAKKAEIIGKKRRTFC